MRVLIVGEMSGAGTALARGFADNGCIVNHIGFANVFRNIYPEINLSEHHGVQGVIDRWLKINGTFFKEKIDLVVFIRYWRFARFDYLNEYMFTRLRERSRAMFFWSLSCDKVVRDTFKIASPLCKPCLTSDSRSSCKYEEFASVKKESMFKSYIDIIVTGSIEYKEAYDAAGVKNVFIPMGIHIEKSDELKVKFSKGLMTLYHSLSNVGYKGSDLFLKASSNEFIEKNYQLRIEEKVPLEEHLYHIDNSDVVFDQLYNRSLGMNGLQVLKRGRVLLCGRLNDYYGDFILPGIISPNVEGIVASLSEVHLNRKYYTEAVFHNFEVLKDRYSSAKLARDFLSLI